MAVRGHIAAMQLARSPPAPPCHCGSRRRGAAARCAASSNGAPSALRVCSFSAQRYVRAGSPDLTTLSPLCRSLCALDVSITATVV